MVGNKSHFAKYVEVKSENLALQAKLDIVLKKNPNIKEKLLTSKDSESRQAPLVLPKLKSQQKRKSLDFFDESKLFINYYLKILILGIFFYINL